MPQSNFILPTVLSTNIAAGVLSSNTGIASVSAPVPAQPQASVRTLLTPEQHQVADTLEVPMEMRRTGAPLTLQGNYA